MTADDYRAAMELDRLQGKDPDSGLCAQMREQMDNVKLSNVQQQIMAAFYAGRREAAGRERIPYATLERVAEGINYETDLAIRIIQQLDDKLIEMQNEKDRLDMEKMRNKKPR